MFKQRGFSLIELLVVIAVIGVLVSLLLPAVNDARRAAKRAACANNLHQIGLAMLNYVDAHRTFPSGYVRPFDADVRRSFGAAWGGMLLPQIEKGPLFDRLFPDFDSVHVESAASELCQAKIPTWRCPAEIIGGVTSYSNVVRGDPVDPHDPTSGNWKRYAGIPFASRSSYVANYGTFPPNDGGNPGNGLFWANSAVAPDGILDGTSSTILVCERATSKGPTTWVAVSYDEDMKGDLYIDDAPRTYRACERLVLGSAHVPPNPRSADESAFSSVHSGGVNVLFADGHVQFVSDSINATVWAGLADPQDGTPMSGF